jgi:lysophospholipase L1-like esterase
MKIRLRLRSTILFAAGAVMATSIFATSPTLASTAKKPPSMFYVSLGDSYAAGAYASDTVTYAAPKHRLILRNFACGGATTTSLMDDIGCTTGGEGYESVAYPTTTQLAGAVSFIRDHRGRIGLITITIGGNDLGGTADDVPPIATNIAAIATQLRAAAGKKVPILGLTYPDADIADWLNGPSGQTTAEESITAFQQVINPDWKAAYATANVTFVDITAASGAYTPLTELVNYSTYGEIPSAVAQICQWTLMCTQDNLHPSVVGNELIARQIVRAFLRLTS